MDNGYTEKGNDSVSLQARTLVNSAVYGTDKEFNYFVRKAKLNDKMMKACASITETELVKSFPLICNRILYEMAFSNKHKELVEILVYMMFIISATTGNQSEYCPYLTSYVLHHASIVSRGPNAVHDVILTQWISILHGQTSEHFFEHFSFMFNNVNVYLYAFLIIDTYT